MKRMFWTLTALLVSGSVAWAAAGKPAPSHHAAAPAAEHPMVASSEEVSWSAAPPVLPAGAQLAVMDGNPMGTGAYTVRLKMPDGYQIKPHWHPAVEHVTVLTGTFNVAMGKTFDTSGGKAMTAGGFGSMPAHMAHFAWTTGETVVQIHGMGPFALTYVNPGDDPSKTASKTAKQ